MLADEPPHRPIAALVDALGPELILVLGDLEPAWIEGLAEVDLPKLGVRGNHDADDSLEAVDVRDLHLASAEVGGLSFAGFGGSPRYRPHGGNQWTEEEAERMMALLPPADVLLTHSPPAGVAAARPHAAASGSRRAPPGADARGSRARRGTHRAGLTPVWGGRSLLLTGSLPPKRKVFSCRFACVFSQ